jgi:large subunit ribosomal protein L15
MPLYRRLPKRGFTCYNSKDIVAVDIETLKRFEDGSVVDEQTLLESGAVSKLGDGVKIIGNADLDRKLTVKVTAFSAAAKEKIEAAGGTAETIGR